MTETLKKDKIEVPHLLLIAGNGRNVGKTTLACRIITHLSKTERVIGIKISPHFHSFSEDEVVKKNANYIILEEKKTTSKDSSRMLKSGANRVFYIMVKQEHLNEAFSYLIPNLHDRIIICESGGLHNFVKPGLFLFVNETGRPVTKTEHLKHHPRVVLNDGTDFNLSIESIRFNGHQISINE